MLHICFMFDTQSEKLVYVHVRGWKYITMTATDPLSWFSEVPLFKQIYLGHTGATRQAGRLMKYSVSDAAHH